MALVVMKFGGSSVADAQKMKKVAGRVIATKKKGNKVVVVVSAPGDTTDDFIKMAKEITAHPDPREMDMLLSTGEQISIALLALAIKEQGGKAISLTGHQVGIYTDFSHTTARITRIRTDKLRRELGKGKIVIVAGFQGINPNEDITTLGRGGSDLTAVALAAVLRANKCEIYTDVEGVYTTDPRLVPEARKIPVVSYDEMLEMASSGAQVMQARSIELGKKFNLDIYVRSTFSQKEGTLITRETPKLEEVMVRGVTYDKNQAKLSIVDLPDRPGVAAVVFGELAKKQINVDMIVQSCASDGLNDISFTVNRDVGDQAMAVLNELKKKLKARMVLSDEDVVKISIVGAGMRSHAGVAARMFSALAGEEINIQMISTSEIKVSCVIRKKDLEKAVKVLHREFELEK